MNHGRCAGADLAVRVKSHEITKERRGIAQADDIHREATKVY